MCVGCFVVLSGINYSLCVECTKKTMALRSSHNNIHYVFTVLKRLDYGAKFAPLKAAEHHISSKYDYAKVESKYSSH